MEDCPNVEEDMDKDGDGIVDKEDKDGDDNLDGDVIVNPQFIFFLFLFF